VRLCSLHLCSCVPASVEPADVLTQQDVPPPNVVELDRRRLSAGRSPAASMQAPGPLPVACTRPHAMTGPDLCQLRALTALTAVELSYDNMAAANAAAGGWLGLQLTRLGLGYDRLGD